MLDELREYLHAGKFMDVRRRLDHKDTKTALAAEAEISVLWAISGVAHMQPEPILPDGRKPDAVSKDLFLSAPSVIEVTALSDHSFSGQEAMDRTANVISNFADSLKKGAGRHLYFKFNERSYYRNNRFHRERCVDPGFALTAATETQLRVWIKAADWPNPQAIRITNGNTDVEVTCGKSYGSTVPLLRNVCEMPPVAYDLEDNPIYKALKKKAGQVKGAESGTLRCIILVDAGCRLLRHLRPVSSLREIRGEEIIHHALSRLGVDVVAVVSPHRGKDYPFGVFGGLFWEVSCFDRRKEIPNREYERFEALAERLPKPKYEGYQARDIHRQGGFSPDGRNWYLGTEVIGRGGRMTVKMSAGLLHEYLPAKCALRNSVQKLSAIKTIPSKARSRAAALYETFSLSLVG